MFVEFSDRAPPPPWRPPAPPSRRHPDLTARQRRALAWIIGLNLFLLLIAPIGGATIVGALSTWWR